VPNSIWSFVKPTVKNLLEQKVAEREASREVFALYPTHGCTTFPGNALHRSWDGRVMWLFPMPNKLVWFIKKCADARGGGAVFGMPETLTKAAQREWDELKKVRSVTRFATQQHTWEYECTCGASTIKQGPTETLQYFCVQDFEIAF